MAAPEILYDRIDRLYSRDSEPHHSIPVRADDHSYCKQAVKKRKRWLNRTTLIRRRPPHPMKLYTAPENHKTNVLWTQEERNYFKHYIQQTPRGDETLIEYWKKCADSLNRQFWYSSRTGQACKNLAQRLFLKVPVCQCDSSNNSSQTNCDARTQPDANSHPYASTQPDASTQTELSLPVDLRNNTNRRADWIYIEPKKELKELASPSVHKIHEAASQRLREYAPLTDADKASLVDVITNGTPRQIARTAMGIQCLGEELKNMLLFDIEMDAKECTNKSSKLYCKDSENQQHFKWDNIISEIVDKQQLLAEVLLAVCLPRDRIGITSTTERLVPVLGMMYGILMKQRYSALNAVQKLVTTTLDKEQTPKKVYERLQPLGVTLSHQGMLDNRKVMAGSSNTNLMDCLKDGK